MRQEKVSFFVFVVVAAILLSGFIPLEALAQDYYHQNFEWTYDNKDWTWSLSIPKSTYDTYRSATWGSGTANAQIVTSDAQLQVPDPANPGKTLGAINVNHLAHELGHVMGLEHPGNAASPPMTGTGTAGTVLEPSGFYKDNPHAQSGNNCTHVGNPLFTFTLMPWASRCISNPEIP